VEGTHHTEVLEVLVVPEVLEVLVLEVLGVLVLEVREVLVLACPERGEELSSPSRRGVLVLRRPSLPEPPGFGAAGPPSLA